jgi:signal transduction protein with GAF and PtsI domain
MNTLTHQLESCFPGKEAWSIALAIIVKHMKADSGTIHLMGADDILHLKAVAGGIPPTVIEAVKFVPVGKGMAGLAAQRREPVTICNIQTDTSGDVRPGAKTTGLEGAIAAPILDGDTVVGVLGVANRKERAFSAEETATLLDLGRALFKASKRVRIL